MTSDIAFDQAGHILVADFYNNRIQIFAADGTYLDQFGQQGEKPGQFDGPTGLAISAVGDVSVVDFHNNRIQRFRLREEGS